MLWFKITISISACAFIWWWNQPCYVQTGKAGLVSANVKRAMQKMGPYKTYRLLPDGRLQVDVNGEWLYLRLKP